MKATLAALAPMLALISVASLRAWDSASSLPSNDAHYAPVSGYVEAVPDKDYRHASPEAYEAFRDLKFGIRVHWGIYSIWNLQHESWPFLQMPYEKRQRYETLYRTWNPQGFDAESWMKLFAGAGARFFTFTTKHHEGFSMFATTTRVHSRTDWGNPGGPRIVDTDEAYSIMETPFHRDVVGELTAAAHRHDIKIDLYFSLPDWHDADFRPYTYHPLQIPHAGDWAPYEVGRFADRYLPNNPPLVVADPTPAEEARMRARLHDQLLELMTRYGTIDMLGLDMWLGPRAWPALRQTLKDIRKAQPDVMIRARGIGNYGDYFTPENFVPGSKQNTKMPWFVIYPLGRSFSYDPDAASYKGSSWIVWTLADTVAKGGNFEIGVGPDASGRFHPEAIRQMLEAGRWLKENEAAIYATRPLPNDRWKDGDDVRLTRSKDGRTLYIVCHHRPSHELTLHFALAAGSQVSVLPTGDRLQWDSQGASTLIETGSTGNAASDLPVVYKSESP